MLIHSMFSNITNFVLKDVIRLVYTAVTVTNFVPPTALTTFVVYNMEGVLCACLDGWGRPVI